MTITMTYERGSILKMTRQNSDKENLFVSWYYIIATWFFVGRSKFAPGTLGTLFAYPVFYFLAQGSTTIREAIISLHVVNFVFFVLGLLAIKRLQRSIGQGDWRFIVIDEVVGVLLALALSVRCAGDIASAASWIFGVGVSKYNALFIVAFIVFRFFDIKKPLLIDKIDRPTPLFIMLDDIVAGLYTAGVIYTVTFITKKIVLLLALM